MGFSTSDSVLAVDFLFHNTSFRIQLVSYLCVKSYLVIMYYSFDVFLGSFTKIYFKWSSFYLLLRFSVTLDAIMLKFYY